MNGEDKFWLFLWMWLAIAFVVLVLGVLRIDNKKTIRMAELGYQQTSLVGQNYPRWQKAP